MYKRISFVGFHLGTSNSWNSRSALPLNRFALVSPNKWNRSVTFAQWIILRWYHICRIRMYMYSEYQRGYKYLVCATAIPLRLRFMHTYTLYTSYICTSFRIYALRSNRFDIISKYKKKKQEKEASFNSMHGYVIRQKISYEYLSLCFIIASET